MLIWGFLCHIILVMLPYTHNLNIMYAWNVIHVMLEIMSTLLVSYDIGNLV